MKAKVADLMRTNDKVIKDLYERREPVVEACVKVQVSEQIKGNDFDTSIQPISCNRVEHTDDGSFCCSYYSPKSKWRNGRCNLSTHLICENKPGKPKTIITPLNEVVNASSDEKQFLNPIKKSKRGS